MFKKICPKCEKKIQRNNRFCSFCGHNLYSKQDNKDYGFLGRNDFDDNSFESMIGNIPLNKLFKTAMKMTEKMMRNIQEGNQQKQNPNNPNMDIQFFVNGKRVLPQKIIRQGQPQQIQKIKREISPEKAKQLAKLPRKEPKTTMKRLSGRLVYELKVPGVQDINDILINQLENSIEIKALSKDKVYSKVLKINLPIMNYELDEGNLILELQAK